MIGSLISILFLGPVYAEGRLPAGTILEAIHLNGETDDVNAMVGRELKRTVYPGKQVMAVDTKVADLVSRNALVRMVVKKGPLRIETRGRALGAGNEGTEIRVMNLESKRTIIAKIIGENLVEVSL